MNAHLNKNQKTKSQSILKAESKKPASAQTSFQFEDNRPEAVAQRKLIKLANNSPRVNQFQAFRDITDNRPKTRKATQTKPTTTHASSQAQPIQRVIDENVPKGTKLYVSNPGSRYNNYQGIVLDKSWRKGMLQVELHDPNNWRIKKFSAVVGVEDLVQLPDSTDFHNNATGDATESNLEEIRKRRMVGFNKGIVEGAFTGRKNEEGKIDPTSSSERINLLKGKVLEFMANAHAISARVTKEQRSSGMFLKLYRGMHSPTMFARKPGMTFTEPLPFSTTFNKSFAKNWSKTTKPNEAVILELQIPINFPMIFLSTPSWLSNFTILGNEIVNQAQQEVTVAPMTFKILSASQDMSHKVFKVVAEKPLSTEDVGGLFNEAARESDQIRQQRWREQMEEARREEEFQQMISASIKESEMDDYDPDDHVDDFEVEAEFWKQRLAKKGAHREFEDM